MRKKIDWFYKDGGLAIFNRASFPQKELPKSICGLFWSTILGICLVPFQWIFLIWNYISLKKNINKTYYDSTASGQSAGGFAIQLLLAVYITCWVNNAGKTWHNTWLTLAVIIAVIVCAGIAMFISENFSDWMSYLQNKYGKDEPVVDEPVVEKEPNIFVEGIKAFKEKACPLIDWKEREREIVK